MTSALLLAGDPRRIWKRYIIALVLVAGLLMTSHQAPQWSIKANAKNAALINESGRQRMLSQRILVLSSQMAEAYDPETAAELNDTVQLFSDSQNELTQNPRVRSELHKLYGSSTELNDRVLEFSLLAVVVADPMADTESAYRDLRAFDSTALLHDLDAVVTAIESMAGKDVERLKSIQNWSLYAAIVILLLEAVLIFLPAQLSVTRFITKLEENSEALRQANDEVRDHNSSLQKMQDELESDRRRDPLTGLANRLGINFALTELTSNYGAPDSQLSVFHIDLTGFRLINDAYGQKSGDLVLKHVANVLMGCAQNPDLVARIGSDEFLIALNADASEADLQTFASALRTLIEKPIDIGAAKCHIGASIGIASTRLKECSPQKLLPYADIALKRAKRDGGGAVLFAMDLLEELRTQKAVAQELDIAFAEHQFTVHYQPIFCSRTRTINSLEALVRWEHPEHGTKSAGEFMEHIYRLGLSSKLDQIVLSRVLEDIESAQARGTPMPKVAINVSAASMMDTDYMERVSACSLPSVGLSLEISESVDFERHMEHMTKRVAEFASKGLEVEIDDFGTGHASIYCFKKLRPSRIKIARELVLDVETAQDTRQMIQTICTLAKSFGAGIVAEGVENEDMASTLSLLGCDYLQGFGLSRPKSFEETLKQLQTLESAKASVVDTAA
ncbi:MAG: EAL domain-containing protein [Henriciella sp.]|nr:EAL domain-containing protein [Henriciella sp.]